MNIDWLFEYRPGVNRRKEQALRMVSEGVPQATICLQLGISQRTLAAWLKSGVPAGDPDLDQLSLVDGLTERERKR